jgi:hypothetical protein
MDYGYTHYTVVLLGCLDSDNNLIVVDEHAERHWIPQRHVVAIKAMLERHQIFPRRKIDFPISSSKVGSVLASIFNLPSDEFVGTLDPRHSLARFIAGGDLFSTQFDGSTLASVFSSLGVTLRPANTNRVQGWAEILVRLGDPDAGIKPTLFIHKRCRHLLDCLPFLQHDPDHPADVLKTNTNEEGLGGDDAADALRYLVATRIPRLIQTKLRGL